MRLFIRLLRTSATFRARVMATIMWLLGMISLWGSTNMGLTACVLILAHHFTVRADRQSDREEAAATVRDQALKILDVLRRTEQGQTP